MAGRVTPEELNALLEGDTPFALSGRAGSGRVQQHAHSRVLLATSTAAGVPAPRRRPIRGRSHRRLRRRRPPRRLAADTVERMGYHEVSVLEGGINAWVNAELTTEWGMNVPSKDFGERIEIHDHVANISADELHARLEEGRPTVILDSRTPEEYQRFAIPGDAAFPEPNFPCASRTSHRAWSRTRQSSSTARAGRGASSARACCRGWAFPTCSR